MKCRHCKRRKASPGRRGLCYSHYFNPAIRQLYPSTHPKAGAASRGVDGDGMGLRLPAKPTHTEPGTEERIRVLAARESAKVALFHPDDTSLGTLDGRAVPWTVPVCRVHDELD